MRPEWLQQLSEELAAHIEPIGHDAPIGCHYCLTEQGWEITLFVSRTEILGGESDGEAFPGRFVFNVAGLLEVLEEVDSCWWQPVHFGDADDLGPHLSITGLYAGELVWVRIPAEQPRALESGLVANVYTGRIESRW